MLGKNNKLALIAQNHRDKEQKNHNENQVNTVEAIKGHKRILRQTLLPDSSSGNTLLIALIICVTLGAAIVGLKFVPAITTIFDTEKGMQFTYLGLATALGIIFAFLVSRAAINKRQKKVLHLPHLINAPAYLKQLAQARQLAQLTLKIDFDNEWSVEQKKDLKDALKEMDPDIEKMTWLSQKTLQLIYQTQTGFTNMIIEREPITEVRYFTNQNFHRKLKSFYLNVLPVLTEVRPIKGIEILILGDIFSPDHLLGNEKI